VIDSQPRQISALPQLVATPTLVLRENRLLLWRGHETLGRRRQGAYSEGIHDSTGKDAWEKASSSCQILSGIRHTARS